jgi:hypothetical protein
VTSLKKTLGIAVLIMIIVIAIGILSALRINVAPPLIEEFEQNLGETNFGDWTANQHVPQAPNNPGHLVQWHIRRASNISRSGAYSAEFFIDGRQDDGTIWLERKVSVKKNAQVRLSISFWLYSEQASFTIAAVVAYAGTTRPTVEEDFAIVGYANEATGWKNYAYVADVNTDSTGEAYIAVGITVRWETNMTYYVDDIVFE